MAEVAPASAATLLSAGAVRARSRNILAAALAGRTRHFRVDRSRIDAAAEVVELVTRRRYPSLAIPDHSRWRHFEAGGVDRGAELTRTLAGRDAAACARSRIDLALVSVLLDAGAGAAWRYAEAESGQIFTRSEGLGVASFRAFVAGTFSSRRDDPLRVDADALAKIDAAVLGRWFQVRDDNPLIGLDGRAKLLRRLGAALQSERATFGDEARPGGLYDALTAAQGARIPAAALLRALLDALGGVWLAGNTLDGVTLGDTWRHPCAGGDGVTAGWVPFHKLSQWLAYSLFEPFE
ncbi:MAG TPA: DUF1688 family protein, partial [Casimicrobiaceae bacterium]|nr:DUF1688 family protein [Casimicrobiaceae bacterium]